MEAIATTPATLAFTLKTTMKSFKNGDELNRKKEVIQVAQLCCDITGARHSCVVTSQICGWHSCAVTSQHSENN